MRRHLLAACIAMLVLIALAPVKAFASEAVPVDISVGIKYGGTATIEPTDGSAPKPQKDKIQVADGEVGYFHIDFYQPGDYAYHISQQQGENKNLAYDGSTYTLQLSLIDENGQMSVSKSVYNEAGTKVGSRVIGMGTNGELMECEVYFENTMPSDPDTPSDPTDEAGDSDGTQPASREAYRYPSGTPYIGRITGGAPGSYGQDTETRSESAPTGEKGTSDAPVSTAPPYAPYQGNEGAQETSHVSGSQGPSQEAPTGVTQGTLAPATGAVTEGAGVTPSISTPKTGDRDLEHYLLMAMASSAGLLGLAVVYAISTKHLIDR